MARMVPWRRGRVPVLVGVAVLTAAGALRPGLQARPPSHVDLVGTYCLSCHDTDKKKGDLALDTVMSSAIADHPEVWEKVVRKLRARQMPPIGKERPGEATYDAVVASLETALDAAAKVRPNPGRP